MDQQVVRSALKSYHNLFSSSTPSLSSLSPSSNYLRLLLTPPALNISFSIQDFADPNTSILLLELRAALIVQDHAKNLAAGKNPDIDASVNQRVSKAVTEAFVAVQVAGMIKGLEDVGVKGNDANVVKKVYLLVGHLSFLCHPFSFLLDSDLIGTFIFIVSLDGGGRCTCRSPLFWSDATNSDIWTITLVLTRSYALCAPCYSTSVSRIDTRNHWVDGCFWIHGLGFG